MERGMVIVGGGQAAARAAKAMRGAGYGGTITIVGEEPHLPYERPLLSKKLLLDPEHPVPYVLTSEEIAEQHIDIVTGVIATQIDRTAHTVRLSDGRELPYERLLLATGSSVRVPTIPGIPADDVLSLRTLDDSRRIASAIRPGTRTCIIGGGFIGLETAASVAELGGTVTVVEASDRLLPRLGCLEASAYVLAHHQAAGIDVRLGTTVVSGSRGNLQLSDGTSLDADLIIAGIGIVPRVELADDAGLAIDDGIIVNEFGQTSDPDVFAAGDVTRHFNPRLDRDLRLESWENANLQADAAGRTMVGVPTVHSAIPWLWSDQGDLNLQAIGSPAAVDAVIVRGGSDPEEGLTAIQIHDDRVVGGFTLNRTKDIPYLRRLVEAGRLALPVTELPDATIQLRRFVPPRDAA